MKAMNRYSVLIPVNPCNAVNVIDDEAKPIIPRKTKINPVASISLELSTIIRSSSYNYITNSINIEKKRIGQEVEIMPRSIKITCHGCGRKVKAYTIKIWQRLDDDGDANDTFGRFRISNHKRGWFKPKCNRSGKIFK